MGYGLLLCAPERRLKAPLFNPHLTNLDAVAFSRPLRFLIAPLDLIDPVLRALAGCAQLGLFSAQLIQQIFVLDRRPCRGQFFIGFGPLPT